MEVSESYNGDAIGIGGYIVSGQHHQRLSEPNKKNKHLHSNIYIHSYSFLYTHNGQNKQTNKQTNRSSEH